MSPSGCVATGMSVLARTRTSMSHSAAANRTMTSSSRPRKRSFDGLEWELRRFAANANRRAWRALEIGCGPGRLMKPMSRHFGEIHGVDVSDEMIARARQNLRDIPARASARDQRLGSGGFRGRLV